MFFSEYSEPYVKKCQQILGKKKIVKKYSDSKTNLKFLKCQKLQINILSTKKSENYFCIRSEHCVTVEKKNWLVLEGGTGCT